jgi:hypothetical protein
MSRKQASQAKALAVFVILAYCAYRDPATRHAFDTALSLAFSAGLFIFGWVMVGHFAPALKSSRKRAAKRRRPAKKGRKP